MKRDAWLVVALLAWLALGKRDRKVAGAGMTLLPSQFAPSVRFWEQPLLAHGSEAVAPIAFLLSWLRVESGGNPCSMGDKWGPDGQPWEVGIWQLDPGNRQVAGGFTAQELRPCCGNVQGDKGATEAPCTRAMTDDEVSVQIRAGLGYIRWCRGVVDSAIVATRTPWLYPSVDYLRAVKSIHGSTIVMTDGLPFAARTLGRGPSTFAEMADVLRANRSALPRLQARLRSGETLLDAVLDNALKTAT